MLGVGPVSNQPRMGLRVLVPQEYEADLKARMVLFLRTVSILAAALLVLSIIAQSATSHYSPHGLVRGWLLAHMAASLASAGMWVFAKSSLCTQHALNPLDVIGVRAICIIYALAVLDMPISVLPEFQALIPISFVLLTRAAILPSTPARTIIIGFPAILPLPILTWFIRRGTSESELPLFAAVLAVSFWGFFAVFASTIVSRMIYGLEQQVRDAMQLGQYALERKIGEGGMGTVYLARHALLRRPTAVKVLRTDRAGEHSIARFEREVQLTSRLHNPHTIDIYDFGRTPDGLFYYAMEYLDGTTLEDLVKIDGPQGASRVVYCVRQVCAALSEAHQLGIIHRDIKPANIMLCNRGGMWDQIKVVDFGLVKFMESSNHPALSNIHTLAGTPQYMAPETLSNPNEVDGRADIYALGAVAYFLLCGKNVFEGNTIAQICAAHMHTPPPAIESRFDGKVPAQLEKIVMLCLAKSPKDRPQTARALRELLDGCGVAEWSEGEAKAWWEQNGEAVSHEKRKAEESLRSSGPGATLAVDFKSRKVSPFASTDATTPRALAKPL